MHTYHTWLKPDLKSNIGRPNSVVFLRHPLEGATEHEIDGENLWLLVMINPALLISTNQVIVSYSPRKSAAPCVIDECCLLKLVSRNPFIDHGW